MSLIAIVGGDDRIRSVEWGPGFRAYPGDETAKMVNAARAGSFRGVIVLSKWSHAHLKNAVKSLPPQLKVAYWPMSIDNLSKNLERFVSTEFPALPVQPGAVPLPPKQPFNPVIAPKVEAEVRAVVEAPKPEPVYIGPDWEPLAEKHIKTMNAGLRAIHDDLLPWTKEEQEALMYARSEAEKQLRVDGRGEGQYIRGVLPLTRKLFVELGGNPRRSENSIGNRARLVRDFEEQRRLRQRRIESAAVARAAKAQKRDQLRVTPAPYVPAPPVEVPPVEVKLRRSVDADRLIKVLRYVREGVDLGLMSKEQAFDNVCDQLDKLLATKE